MTLRKWTACALLATGAVAVSAGMAQAGPIEQAPPPGGDGLYHTVVLAHSVVTELDRATFVPGSDGATVIVRGATGAILGSIPLRIDVRGRNVSARGDISPDGHRLTVTPERLPLRQAATPLENQLAANDGLGKMGQAAFAGPLVGAVVGAIVGLVVAVASCAILTVACLATALPTVGAFAAGGGVLGTILLVGGATAGALSNYLETLQAPPGQSRYNKGLNGAGVPDANFRFPQLALSDTGSASGSSGSSGK